MGQGWAGCSEGPKGCGVRWNQESGRTEWGREWGARRQECRLSSRWAQGGRCRSRVRLLVGAVAVPARVWVLQWPAHAAMRRLHLQPAAARRRAGHSSLWQPAGHGSARLTPPPTPPSNLRQASCRHPHRRRSRRARPHPAWRCPAASTAARCRPCRRRRRRWCWRAGRPAGGARGCGWVAGRAGDGWLLLSRLAEVVLRPAPALCAPPRLRTSVKG